MEDSGSAIVIILLLFFFIWISMSCDNIFWKHIEKCIEYIREYYCLALTKTGLCLPSYQIPMYSPVPCPPSKPPCESNSPPVTEGSSTSAQNIINITCGGSTSSPCSVNKQPCVKPTPKPVCPSVCGNQSEVTLGCYRYIIDQLPGFIYKYQIDTCGQIMEDTRVVITHTFGVLKRISVDAGKIVVEDSFSVEHVAVVDPVTGLLSF